MEQVIQQPGYQPKRGTHPILIVAGVAVTVFSLVGIGAIMGWIPTGSAKNADPMAVTAEATGTMNAAAPAAVQPAPAPKVVKKVVVHKPAPVQVASAPAAAPLPAPVAYEPPPAAAPVQTAQAKPICLDCGVIQSVREVEQKGEASAVGTIGGGVAGAVLGHQVGKGNGNTAMTILGAVGGALAGREVEKQVKKTKSYEISVRFEDGSTRTLTQSTAPSWRNGDHVRVVGNEIYSNS